MADMDYNFEAFALKQKEIARLEASKNVVKNRSLSSSSIDRKVIEKKEAINGQFETKVKYYLNEIKNLEPGRELLDHLPSKEDYDFEKILIRLMAESLKDTKDYIEMFSPKLNNEEKLEIKKEIIKERKKIAFFQKVLKMAKQKKKTINDEKQENNLIFVPTLSGNIRVLNEIESIDQEYYQRFYGLFQSIKNGTFKNFKSLSGNEFVSIFEVRDTNVRVVYQLLDKNYYAIITSFIKRSSSEGGYRDKLGVKIANYQKLKAALKKKLVDKEFLEENRKYETQLFDMLKNNGKGQLKK